MLRVCPLLGMPRPIVKADGLAFSGVVTTEGHRKSRRFQWVPNQTPLGGGIGEEWDTRWFHESCVPSSKPMGWRWSTATNAREVSESTSQIQSLWAGIGALRGSRSDVSTLASPKFNPIGGALRGRRQLRQPRVRVCRPKQEAFGLALRGQTGCLREAMDGAVPNSKPLGWH